MLTRPRSAVDNPSQGARNLFPEGTFMFTIMAPTNERVSLTSHDELEEFMTTDKNSFKNNESKIPMFTGDRETTSVWLGNAQPVDDDSPNVGDRKFFQNFITADGTVKINDVEDQSNGEGTEIRRLKVNQYNGGLDLYFSLADALGATFDEDGAVHVSEDFCTSLQDETYDDSCVIATIEHRTKKFGEKKGDVYHVCTGFQAI